MPIPERIQASLDVAVSGIRDVESMSDSLDKVSKSLLETAGASEGTEKSIAGLNREMREVASSSGVAAGGLTGVQGELVASSTLAEALEGDIDDMSSAIEDIDPSKIDALKDQLEMAERDDDSTISDVAEDWEVLNEIVDDTDTRKFQETIDKIEQLQQQKSTSGQGIRPGIEGFEDIFDFVEGKDQRVVGDKIARMMSTGLDDKSVDDMAKHPEMTKMLGSVEDIDTDVISTYIRSWDGVDDAGEALARFSEQTDGVGDRFRDISEGLDLLTDGSLPKDLKTVSQLIGSVKEDDGGIAAPLDRALKVGDPGSGDAKEAIVEQMEEVGIEDAKQLQDMSGEEVREALEFKPSTPDRVGKDENDLRGKTGLDQYELDTFIDRVISDVSEGQKQFDDERGFGSALRTKRGELNQTIIDSLAGEGPAAGMISPDLLGLEEAPKDSDQAIADDLNQLNYLVERVDDEDTQRTDRATSSNHPKTAPLKMLLKNTSMGEELTKEKAMDATVGEMRRNARTKHGRGDEFEERFNDPNINTAADEAQRFIDDFFDKGLHEGRMVEGLRKKDNEGIDGIPAGRNLPVDEIMDYMGLDPDGSVGSIEGLDSDSDAVQEITEALIQFGDILDDYEDLPDLFDEMPDGAHIEDIIDTLDGEQESLMTEWAENYGDEMMDVMKHLHSDMNPVDSEDDLTKKIGDSDVDIPLLQQALVSDVMTDLEEDLSDYKSASDSDLIPREVLQAQLLQRGSKEDSDAIKRQLGSLYSKTERGGLGISKALPETEKFKKMTKAGLQDRLIDRGISESQAQLIAGDMASGMSERFKNSDKLNHVQDVLGDGNKDRLTGIVGRSVDWRDTSVSKSPEMVAALEEEMQEVTDALVGERVRGFRTTFDDAYVPSDVYNKMSSGTGKNEIPSGLSQDQFVQVADGMDDVRKSNTFGKGGIRDGPLPDIDGIETKLMKYADAMDMSSRKTEKLRGGLRGVSETFGNFIPILSVTSGRLGPFNVAMGNMAKSVGSLIALLGPLITMIVGLAAALGTATIALTAFVGAGGLFFLQAMENQMAGVNSKGEAMKEIFEAIKPALMDALDPIRNASIGGTGPMEAFVMSIKGGISIVESFSQTVADIVELPEMATSLERINTAMSENDGSLGRALTQLTKELLPAVTDFIVYLVNGLPKFVDFLKKISGVMAQSWGPALSNIVTLLKPILRYGTGFLTVVGLLISALTELIVQVRRLIPGFDYLVQIGGVLVGIYYAYSVAATIAAVAQANWNAAVAGAQIVTTGLTYALWIMYGAMLAGKWITLGLTGAMYSLMTAESLDISLTGILTAVKGAYSVATTIATVATIGLAGAIYTLLGPVGLVVVALGALTAVAIGVMYLFEDMDLSAQGLIDTLSGMMDVIPDMSGIVSDLANAWDENVNGVLETTLDYLNEMAQLMAIVPGISADPRQQRRRGAQTAGMGGERKKQRVEVSMQGGGGLLDQNALGRWVKSIAEDVLNQNDKKSGSIRG